jgi:adenylate kinase
MNIVLTGIQGSGKSTQGNLLSKQLKIPYLSTGHIFRELAKQRTKLGNYIKMVMNSGLLISDEKTIEIVEDYLKRPEYKRGFIIDGFPRTLHQAKHFDKQVDKVIYIEIPDKEVLWRLSYRKDDDGREDENLEALRKRIELFHKHTEPVIHFFGENGKLARVDGNLSIDQVNEEILKSIGKQVIHNHIKAWEQKKKTIIAVVGLAGAGKDEATSFFSEKGIPVVHFGNIINDYVQEHSLPQTEETHKKLRVELRQKHGMEAMAKLSHEKIEKALEKNIMIAINGLYSWEEYVYLKKEFPHVNVCLLAIHAHKHIRYERIANRKSRAKLGGEERDIHELTASNKGAPIAFADYMIENNGSKEELYEKLEDIYRMIYFT